MEKQLPNHLLGLTFERDDRWQRPHERGKRDRLASFRGGWTRALNGEEFETDTLEKLTWANYGYRLGMIEGEIDPDLQEQIFEALYQNQQRKLDERNSLAQQS